MDRHQVTNIEDIKRFLLAGKATFTIESTKTGKWFTYRIKRKEFENQGIKTIFFFVSTLTGPENNTCYTYMGSLSERFALRTTAKSKIKEDATSFKALDFFTKLLSQNKLHNEINFYHSGICAKCGKKLTVPESIQCGLGPYCRNY